MARVRKIAEYLWHTVNFRRFIFFVVASFIAHLDKFLLGSYALYKTHDQFDSFWPYQVALAKRILSFQMPGWFPDYVGGLPFFYMDINWLFFPMLIGGLFRDPWATVVITMMQFVLAGFGAYLFLKHFLDLDDTAGILGGLLWALGTFNLTYWRIFDLAVIPMLFYCTDKIVSAPERKTKLLLLVGLLISTLNIQFARGALFLAFFQLFFIFFSNREWRKTKKTLLFFALVWLFVTIINLPVIISLLTSAAIGSRSLVKWVPESTPSLAFYWRNLVNFIIGTPSMNFGFIGSLIFFFSLTRLKQWAPLVKKLLIFYLVILFFVLFVDQAVWFQTVRQHLPLRDFRLSRFILPGPFIFLILLIAGFKDFLVFVAKDFKKVFLFVLMVLFALVLYHFTKHPFPSNYIEVFSCLLFSFIFLAGVLALSKNKTKPLWLAYFIIGLILLERLTTFNLIRVADVHPPSFVHIFKSELFDKFRPAHKYDYRIAFINWHPTVGIYNGYQVAGGYASQYMRSYAIFWASILQDEKDEFLSYVYKAYLIDKNVENEDVPPKIIEKPTFKTDLLALNNVRYIFSFNDIERPEKWGLSIVNRGTQYHSDPSLAGLARKKQTVKRLVSKIFTTIPYYVFEVKNYQPRVYLAGGYRLVNGEIGLKDYLKAVPIGRLRKEVVYDRHDLSLAELKALKTKYGFISKTLPRITKYSDNRIEIEAVSDRSCQLVLVENYSQDWTASVNGQPVEIMPAYGVFRSVLINKGSNKIIFEYRPSYLLFSLWFSAIGGAFMLFIGLFWALKKEKY
ncbi:YfhO family protein [Candidatus Saganbacteria bacterium]|nr:YfhO family protein [Candidatus Saganbacteria bacterium]